MIRTRSFRTLAALFATSLAASPALAQVSEARLQELVKQAAEAVKNPAPAFSATQAPPEGGPRLPLTLDDAVKLALEKNLDIAVQRVNPQLQDVAVASAYAFYHPSLTSTISKQSQVGTPQNQLQLASGGRGVTQDQAFYNGGIIQNFRWFGSSVAATLNNNRTLTDSNNTLFNPVFNANWSAIYTQPLLRDFKIDAQRRQLAVSHINRDISDVQLRASITNTISNVRNAYWDFLFATGAVEVAQQSLDLASKLVEDNQTRVEIGTMAPIDVVQAQAEQATRRQALVTAESARRTTELALKRLIVAGTEDPTWNATLEPTERAEFRPEPIDIAGAIRRALSERTDVAIAKKNIENNNLTVSYLRNQALPTMDLQVTYGLQGIGGTRLVRDTTQLGSPITGSVPGGIGDSLSSLLNANYPRWTIALNLAYPIGTSTQDAAVARSRLQTTQVEAQIKQIELQVATEVTNAAISVRNSAEAVQAAQAARDLSQKRLEAEQSKFEVGMSTNYFVVQAQRDLNDARNSELRVVLNYRKALVELERLQQTTLQNSNITIVQAGGGAGAQQ